MKRRSLLIGLVLLMVTSLALGACAAPSVEEVVQEAVQATEEAVVEEPAEEAEAPEPPAEEEMATEEPVAEADLDGAFSTFLGDLQGYGLISIADLSTALAEEPPFLLDVREVAEVEENGYIEGTNALIPLRELAQNVDKLPSFDTPVVVYCGSGWRSAIAMTALEAMGWTDVKSLKGGFAAWTEAGNPAAEGLPAEAEALGVAEPDPAVQVAIDANLSTLPEGWGVLAVEDLAAELAENPDIILIDVRLQEELDESGWLEGAIHVPLEEFITSMSLWPTDKSANIVVYCKAGHRGAIAMTILRTFGFTNVRNLKGGFDAWATAGNPVVTE
jgi:rhodanese-related sulfurtransferase